jgi:hypothetical protein
MAPDCRAQSTNNGGDKTTSSRKKRKKYIELRKHIELKIEKTEKNTEIKDEKVCRRENKKR